MDDWLILIPVLLPLSTAILAAVLPKSRAVQAGLSVAATALLVFVSLAIFAKAAGGTILTVSLGSWPAPFGIVMVADLLSAVMLCITSIIALATAVYAIADIDRERLHFGFHSFLQFLLCGICGAFLTGDLFNLYVWFEVMLISSFALLSLGGGKRQLYGTIKYIALNLISTLLLLSAIGLLYGMTGHLNLASLAVAVPQVENANLVTATAILFLIAFGIKAAVFPLFFWLPASYHMPPVTVSAIFAGLLTKVGVYALYRVFSLLFTHDVEWTHTILLWVAGLTMVTGVLGAAVQQNIRRILSFHIISQIGYMIMGLALFTKAAILGGVFYTIHHIIVKANLFFIGGIVERRTGNPFVRNMGGLYRVAPWFSLLFLVPALSLAGIPPLSGFWAKFLVIRAGLDEQAWLIVAAALFTGLMTIYSMLKIWNEAFWKRNPERPDASLFDAPPHGSHGAPPLSRAAQFCLLAPCALLAALTIWIGLWPQPFLAVADQIADQLMNNEAYVQAVLHSRQSPLVETMR
ncbi:MAG: Na+/H+ antiporter subunit D [Alphaproteobacteria bacterium]|nr:Na+/H+ antiporter subunit D [Alphaproteobacteria bacterium]